ncbi:MAG: tRNA 2-thiocytidine(32) synthetase TtcA [Gammaproteobacteria bacterium]|nr:tRNA 2-thiocytidine(32) synthetase TtcA [Gammaproteobacteria bacterium]
MSNRAAQLEKKLRHYTGKAISDYKLIAGGDKVLACLSGGKDSLVMVDILKQLQPRSKSKFELTVFILNPGLPGFDTKELEIWLKKLKLNYVVHNEDIYSIVKQKAEKNRYCMLCSRLRRGIIYSYAKEHGFTKIALGHHREDLITSLLMSIFYQGEIASMPPKLFAKSGNIVIRPLCYCQEKDIAEYAIAKNLPILHKTCEGKENPTRDDIGNLIKKLAQDNPKIPSNMLHSLQRIRPSQLMDKAMHNFNQEDI